MALVFADRVKETTTTTGTGTVNLAGASTGYQTFVAGVGSTNTCYYCIAGQTTAEWEVGLGTVTSGSPNTLARNTVLASSNANSAVNFSAGTKDVFVTYPASQVVASTATQTLTNKTLTDPAIIGTIIEDVFTITDGAAFEVDPANGSVQLITLGASRTPKATNFLAGESVTLMVDDGTAYTITWTDATWGTGGVKWVGGIAPTLTTTGYTVIQFWKVSTQVYGALVGNA
jgi:hypothetical protein